MNPATAFGADAALVTPTRRLAGLLSTRYAAAMRHAGHAGWTTPRILPLSAWVGQVHREFAWTAADPAPDRFLLNADQEFAVWQRVVAEAGGIDPGATDTIARLAMDAWSTVQHWQLPPVSAGAASGRAELRAFARYARDFVTACDAIGAIDRAAYLARVAALPRAALARLSGWRFVGFTRPPAVIVRLLRTLDRYVDDSPCAAPASARLDYRAFSSNEIELAAAMDFAAAARRDDPAQHVCIALCGVSRIDAPLQMRLERAFDAAYTGGGESPGLDCTSGRPLAESALASDALLWLEPARRRHWREITRLLSSPYTHAGTVERCARAAIDATLRRRGEATLGFADVVRGAERAGDAGALTAAQFAAWETLAAKSGGKRTFHAWVTFAEELLAAVRWPGEQGLNADELAAYTAWQSALDGIAALDAVLPPCTWSAAVATMRQAIRRQQYAARAQVDAVAVVSLEEAQCLAPDALWVAGLHDTAWPQAAEPNPMLPLPALREHGVPGADPEREFHYGETVIQAMAARHPAAIWSYALIDESTPRRPWAGRSAAPQPDPPSPTNEADAAVFADVDDATGLPLTAHESVRGGVSLFTDQAACPFRAYARHRLGARAPDDPAPGLSAIQRGELVHALLQAFWTALRTREALVAMTPEVLGARLREHAAEVTAAMRARVRLPDVFWELENERLCELALEWLDVETTREPFQVVACEAPHTLTIGPLTIETRIDRIDRLTDDARVIIDYKTGVAAARSWDVPRPDQPQLPLYALGANDVAIAGVAYARVRAGACRFIDRPAGIVKAGASSEKSAAAWHEAIDEWRSAIDELACAFQAGDALVDPKRDTQTCRVCDLHAFCRIAEVRPSRDDDIEEDDDI